MIMFIIYTGDYMNNCHCNQIDILKCIAIGITIIFLMVFIVVIIIFNNDNVEKETKFSQNDIVVGNALTHEEGSDIISINETGIYQISYQLFGIKEGAGSFNFNAVLLVNDVPVESTFNDGPVLEDLVNNRLTLTSTVILRLNAGNTLKLAGISIEEITYEKARIDIEKID